MKLTSYKIREALREGRHIDAAEILAQHYGFIISSPPSKVQITCVPYKHYAIRMWMQSRGFEWEDGDFYSAVGVGESGPLVSMIVWKP